MGRCNTRHQQCCITSNSLCAIRCTHLVHSTIHKKIGTTKDMTFLASNATMQHWIIGYNWCWYLFPCHSQVIGRSTNYSSVRENRSLQNLSRLFVSLTKDKIWSIAANRSTHNLLGGKQWALIVWEVLNRHGDGMGRPNNRDNGVWQ